MTDLGAWAAEWYRIPEPTFMTDISHSDPLEGDDDTETQQNS
jgi:endogenous inhibitor of DNA gyrase (YacG/DUF329 family)